MHARTHFSAWLAALLLPLLALSAARVHAEATDYGTLLKEGVNEFAAGNWGEARLLFRRAHEISPTARTYRGLALCDFELRHYVEAIEELEASLQDQRRPLTPELREQVEQTLERARQYVAHYRLRVPEGVTRVDVDGKTRDVPPSGELVLDPGSHTLAIQTPEGERISREITADVGASEELALLPAPRPSTPEAAPTVSSPPTELAAQPSAPSTNVSSGSPRVFTWVAAGLTGVFGAGIVGFGLAAQAKHTAYMDQARGGMPPDAALKRSGQTFETLTNVSIIGCAVAGAAAITLFFVEGKHEESPALQAGIHPTGAYLRGQF